MRRPQMSDRRLGRIVTAAYGSLPFRHLALRWVTRAEGGAMRSVNLRRILHRYHGVSVGHFSYGSLLEPGRADRDTTIGAFVSIGPDVRRFGAAHPLDAPCLHPYWYNARLGIVPESADVERSPCWIGHGTWIGAGVLILPGCRRIGIGAVVGAGSVVTHDVPDFAVVVGNPARQMGTRLDEETRSGLLASSYWELDPLDAQQVLSQFRVDK